MSTDSRNLHGCLVAALVVVGIVLTLPGICSIIGMGLLGGIGPGAYPAIFLLTFLIAGGGIGLVVWAVRNR